MSRQKTIKSDVTVEGKGLFGGQATSLTFKPAEANVGVVFCRADMDEMPRIPLSTENLAKRSRRTTLMNGKAGVETVEHVLSAVMGLGIDNLLIEVAGEEAPNTDGSPLAFAEALTQAGTEEQDANRRVFTIEEPVTVQEGESMLAALPGPTDCLDILYELDYPSIPAIGRQVYSFRLGQDDYLKQLAPARTFLTRTEADQQLAAGVGTHLSARDMLVMDADGPVDNELRFADEHARHKVADLIGDIALLGRGIRGRIVAYKSGHELNHQLVRKLSEQVAARKLGKSLSAEPVMDIRKVMRLLPHRYPFLMVDRIVEVDGDDKAVGVKNVTINEPYFQGHYPHLPIMPGVMILEALAQLSGILLSRRLEHTGKVAMLLSMDKVKMRRPVRPGDQLVLVAEAIRVRSRTGHCRCHAKVGNDIAAEAEIKFMLVDAEPI